MPAFFRTIPNVLLALALSLCAAGAANAAESDFLTQVRQLTLEGRRAGEGYFDSTGKKIIFQSEREPGNPFYQIYILDLTTGDTHRVSPGKGKTTCSFFRPGGGRVLFASTHLDPQSEALQKAELDFRASGKERRYSWDYDPHFDIFESNEDGTAIKRLTTAEGYDAEGSYSPDGKKIAFCSIRDAYPADKLSADDRKRAEIEPSYFGEIYIMDADGSNQKRLTFEPGYDGGPFFTPDGERIVWRRFDAKNPVVADVYSMRLDGSDARRITDFNAMSWAPYFHPSGDYAVFASNKLGFDNFEIYLVDAAGKKEPVRVTSTDGFDGLPVFSPDGKNLCWTSTRHAGGARESGQLYYARWNDAAARKALESAPPRGAAPAASNAAAASPAPSVAPADSAVARLKAHVEFLASDALEGRMTGSPGERAAADYIEKQFKAVGLQPLTDKGGFFSEFTFTSGFRMGPTNALSFWKVPANPHLEMADRFKQGSKTADLTPEKDFAPLSISNEGEADGALAFAGYGLVVPGQDGKTLYDSYEKLDVKGKIAVVLRYVPEDVPAETRQIYNRYAGLRFKALQARERGAVGLLVVTGPRSPHAGELVPLALDSGGFSSGIIAASITLDAADRLIAPSGKKIADLQAALDPGKERTTFTIDDAAARIKIDLIKESKTGHNVIGLLPPPGGLKPDSQLVVIGAHYDHLGRGGDGNSLSRKGEEGQIHHGADDNASGVGAMIEIARSIAAKPVTGARGVIFAAWSGEETGLLGSAAFCKSPPIEITRLAAYLNMDMVGRLKDDKLTIQGLGSSPAWRSLIEKKNVVAGFSLALSDDPYLPTDSTSFYVQGVPGLHFFSGAHEDYHRPTDTADKINYEGMERIGALVESIARDLCGDKPKPEYAKVQQSAAPAGGGRDSLRAYLGTIPDYTEEKVGVKLSGVRGGSPADKAGLRGGDVIIEFAGQKITNIYDYTYALDAVKIGKPVEIVVMRDGKRTAVTVTPEARP